MPRFLTSVEKEFPKFGHVRIYCQKEGRSWILEFHYPSVKLPLYVALCPLHSARRRKAKVPSLAISPRPQ